MKIQFLFVCLLFGLSGKAQNTEHKMSVAFNAGLIFTHFAPNIGTRVGHEAENEWNLELRIEENKKGWGFIARYIAAPGFIPNPFFKRSPYPQFDIQTLKVGDLIYSDQKFENFSFLINKRLFLINQKHRIDWASGMQLRKGFVSHYEYYGGTYWHNLTPKSLDKYGLLSRVGYSYLINKHFSVSTNIEYSRFKIKPADFWDVNILAGFRF